MKRLCQPSLILTAMACLRLLLIGLVWPFRVEGFSTTSNHLDVRHRVQPVRPRQPCTPTIKSTAAITPTSLLLATENLEEDDKIMSEASDAPDNDDLSPPLSSLSSTTFNDVASLRAAAAAASSKKDSDKKGEKLDPNSSSALKSVASKRTKTSKNPNLQKTITSSKKNNRWDSFDYTQHWYPVVWDCDVLPNHPTKVTLFDVDYVIAKNSQTGEWTALEDQCPHKAAALSEGRLTSSGYFQCAYHGWSFDGTTGDCVQIPQAAAGATSFPPNSCARPIPIREHQTMVWLWPGPMRASADDYPDPPTVPEMDFPGWKVLRVIRDFDQVDWPLLASNIMDPDHGLFAHGALPFDWYSGSAKHPLKITEESFDNAGWTLSSQVPAVDKVLAVDRSKRQAMGLKVKEKKQTEDIQGTSRFIAPTTTTLCRRDVNDETSSVTAFWVTPVGTGRSRFMSAALFKSGKIPLTIPRWVMTINLNRFLDQDTLLVATQQPPLLRAEAEGVEEPRASLYSYGSATDKTVRLIDQFWDSTLFKVPNRAKTLQNLYRSGQLQRTPPREVVLDRKVQHLDICPDAQGFVKKCHIISRTSLAIAATWVVKALWDRVIPKRTRWLPILSLALAWITDQLRNQYYFVKTEASRNKDLNQTPKKVWLDP